uniref:Calcyclin-binding protein n=1 Tax=Anopheles dirus TaxID=7168 RepID=A0A182N6A4_9DIPT
KNSKKQLFCQISCYRKKTEKRETTPVRVSIVLLVFLAIACKFAAIQEFSRTRMSREAIENLTLDLEEMRKLAGSAQRSRVQQMLAIDIRKLETDIQRQRDLLAAQASSEQSVSRPVQTSVPGDVRRYQVELKEYAWDQSDKFIKIFVTVNGVQQVPEDNVNVEFTENSFQLVISDLNNKDYIFVVNNLLNAIDTEKSYRRVKSDMVAIYLAKQAPTKWAHLTLTAKRLQDLKDERLSDGKKSTSDDPSSGLMNIMQQLYESGDPETKRMINKAWHESQTKQKTATLDIVEDEDSGDHRFSESSSVRELQRERLERMARPKVAHLEGTLAMHGHRLKEGKIARMQTQIREIKAEDKHSCRKQATETVGEKVSKNSQLIYDKLQYKLRRLAFDDLADQIFEKLPEQIVTRHHNKRPGQLTPETKALWDTLQATLRCYLGQPSDGYEERVFSHLCFGLTKFIEHIIENVHKKEPGFGERVWRLHTLEPPTYPLAVELARKAIQERKLGK